MICDSPSLQQFSLGMFLLYPKLRISCLTGNKTDWQWDLGKKQTKIHLLETLQGCMSACFSTFALIFEESHFFRKLLPIWFCLLPAKEESYLIRDASGEPEGQKFHDIDWIYCTFYFINSNISETLQWIIKANKLALSWILLMHFMLTPVVETKH